MHELQLLLAAIDDTAMAWEPDDAAAHMLALLRRNLEHRMCEAHAGLKADSDAAADTETDPY